MALPRASDIEIIGSGGSGGTSLGGTTSELISFYGTAAVAQQSVAAIATTTISQVGTSGKWAFATSTAALAFVAAVISLQDKLDTLGLVVES